MNGSVTDTSYDRIGLGYSRFRKPDPRIAARLMSALGDARTVINVGAGTGSYEPTDRVVLAVEPSEEMVKQRPPDAAPCIRVDDLPNPTGQRQIPQSQPLRLGVVGHSHHSSGWYARGMYTATLYS